MNILITGADGYLGWPTLLKLSRAFPDDHIIGVDNSSRRKWVAEIGSVSAVPIAPVEERLRASRQEGFHNITFREIDLTNYRDMRTLISIFRPEVVIHAAAQPSAPYSEMSAETAAFTQKTNVAMTLNILWALREEELTGSHYIETTTTGIYGAPSLEIPERHIQVTGTNGRTDLVPYPNMGPSWYHVSKGFNTANMRLMHVQTNMPITDVRTAIVYGTNTKETEVSPALATRFDFDFYFGTLYNRWIAMSVIGEPLMIYGSGHQTKPFIHLEDAAESLVAIAKGENASEYRTYHQLSEFMTLNDLAQLIVDYMDEHDRKTGVTRIPNPRIEREDSSCRYENKKFLALLARRPRTMKDTIEETFTRLAPHREILIKYRKRLIK